MILFVLAFASSCKEDIDLTGDAQETAVVYGLLNRADSIHYVKINRAFISNDNSLVTAQIPDSNYFRNVEATIKEVVGGAVTRTWILKDTLIENKEPGVFFAPEQKVYYFKTSSTAPLLANDNTIYTLDVDINEGEFMVSGKTELVRNMSLTAPSMNGSYTFANSPQNAVKYASSSVSFVKGTSTMADVRLKIAFDEFIGTTLANTKTFDWKLAEYGPAELSGTPNAVANGNTFYTLISQNATNNPAITRRKLKYISVVVTGGADELQNYISINKPSSSLAQTKPTFTNLTANNGRKVVGVFSSRGSLTLRKADWSQVGNNYFRALDINSMRELAQGSITGHLLFCTDNPIYGPATQNPQPFFCN